MSLKIGTHKIYLMLFVLLAGPNLIFFNERARGLPSGIVLGQTSRPCVTLDAGLTAAKLHYQMDLTPQTINKIEVKKCHVHCSQPLFFRNTKPREKRAHTLLLASSSRAIRFKRSNGR